MTSKIQLDSKETERKNPNKKPIPDGGYGWVVLIASFLISFTLDGIMYSFGIIIKPLQSHYKANNEQTGLITSFNTGFLFCSGPIVAGLSNTFGCRTVVMGGAVVTSILYFLCVFSPSIYAIMALYGVLGGVSTGCTYIASLIIIAEYFDKKIGIATGITMAGSGLGSFVLPPLIEYLIKHYDWKFTLSVCAGGILICCIFGAFLRPLNPKSTSNKSVELKNMNKTLQDENELDSTNNFKVVQSFMGSQLSINKKKLPLHQRNKFLRLSIEILKEMTNFKLLTENMSFLLITLSNFILFTGYFLPFLYLIKIADANDIENSSVLISIIGITNIPFRMAFGFIADRRIITPVNLNTLSVAVATVPFFFYELVLQHDIYRQAVFAFLFAVGTAGMNSLTTAYLVDLVGLEKFSNATGIINLFRGFGCFIGPFIGGLIADKLRMIDTFYFSGICFVVGLALTCMVSFGEMFKRCCNKPNDSEDNHKLPNESELNANLLENKNGINA